jgi:hypothetical protein
MLMHLLVVNKYLQYYISVLSDPSVASSNLGNLETTQVDQNGIVYNPYTDRSVRPGQIICAPKAIMR